MQNRQVKPLLRAMLKELPCRNVSVIDIENDDNIFCCFQSKCSMIAEDLTHLFKPVKPTKIYQAGAQSYVAVYSRQAVAEFIEVHFKKFINRILRDDFDGHYDNRFGYIFINETTYSNFIHDKRVLNAAWAVGLDYGWTEQREYIPQFNPYVNECTFSQDITTTRWLNFCSNGTAIYRAIFPENIERIQQRNERQTFLQGARSFHSGIYCLTNGIEQHRDVIRLIFSFLSLPSLELEKKSSPTIPCKIETDELQANHFITKITILKKQLEKENKKSADAVKKDKAEFLKCISIFKKANPRFALRECLHLSETFYPHLYKTAQLGKFSRTKKLIDEIKQPKKDAKKCRTAL